MTTETAPTIPAEDWALEDLREEVEDVRRRLNLFRTSLGRYFVETQELIDHLDEASEPIDADWINENGMNFRK